MMEAERIDNIGIQISQTNLDSSCILSDLFLPDQFGAGVLAQSTSHVVITFFYPSFPSRDYTPCYGFTWDLFFLSLDEPGAIFVCTAASP